jgi:Putative mono-oxygenase ydhR
MYIRIVTFGLTIPVDEYEGIATELAPGFAEWPGLLAKWWLGDVSSGTYGGVYLFSGREAADLSRSTALFTGLLESPALRDVEVREYDLLEAPTAVTAPVLQRVG